MAFTEEQVQRYSRHIILSEVGGKGQRKINAARVFVVGAGGLGSPVSLYLAAAGVGTLGIIDADTVDLSNLQRQVIHHTPDLGKPKVFSAMEKINAINPDVKVVPYQDRLTAGNALSLIREYDIVVDGTDNFPAKFLINDAAVLAGKPLVHGGILRFEGQVLTILPGKSACYRCIYSAPPPAGLVPSCQEAGVLGALAGLIGTIQGTEVLKLILGIGQPLADRILRYDALKTELREVRVRKNPRCRVCGETPTLRSLEQESYQQEEVCQINPGEVLKTER
jgi:adenylyltransferase/sulfurtransferase